MSKGLLLGLSIPLGLVIGSVLTMVIDRVPERWPVFRPGPRCPHCEAPIAPRHLVPVVSWFMLRGRCASCNERITVAYPIVECVTAFAFAAAVVQCRTPLAGGRVLAVLLRADRGVGRRSLQLHDSRSHRVPFAGRVARVDRGHLAVLRQPAGHLRCARRHARVRGHARVALRHPAQRARLRRREAGVVDGPVPRMGRRLSQLGPAGVVLAGDRLHRSGSPSARCCSSPAR